MDDARLAALLQARAAELLGAVWLPGVMSALAAAALLGRWARRRPRPLPPLRPAAPGPALLLAAGAYAAFALAALFLGTVLRRHPYGEPLQSLLAPLVGLALALWAGERVLPGGLAALGLRRCGASVSLGPALLIYVAGLPVFYLLQQLSLFPPRLQPQVLAIAATPDPCFRGLYFAAVAGSVPWCEEVLFRGLLLRAGVGLFGVRGGVVFAAVTFALVHPPYAWLPILWLGLVLGVTVAWTGSLAAAVFVHALHNAGQFLLVLLVAP